MLSRAAKKVKINIEIKENNERHSMKNALFRYRISIRGTFFYLSIFHAFWNKCFRFKIVGPFLNMPFRESNLFSRNSKRFYALCGGFDEKMTHFFNVFRQKQCNRINMSFIRTYFIAAICHFQCKIIPFSISYCQGKRKRNPRW